MRMNFMNTLALTLAIIGALNWGLVGFFAIDIVAALFGEMTPVSRVIYTLVGLSGLYLIFAVLMRKDRTPTATALR